MDMGFPLYNYISLGCHSAFGFELISDSNKWQSIASSKLPLAADYFQSRNGADDGR